MREGWEAVPLKDLVGLVAGQYLPKADYDGGPFPVFGSNSLMGWVSEPLVVEPHVVMAAVGANAGACRYSSGPSWVNNNDLGPPFHAFNNPMTEKATWIGSSRLIAPDYDAPRQLPIGVFVTVKMVL